MNAKLISLFLGLCFLIPLLTHANNLVLYKSGEENISLTGVLKVKKFPAPPKSENIGDKAEIYRYLVLDQPIDFLPAKYYKAEKVKVLTNIKEAQIVKCVNSSNWSNKLIGKHVRITGTLTDRIVRVIIIANHFEEIK